MEYLVPACEAEVAPAFLRAQIDSPRFEDRLRGQLQQTGARRETFVDHANLTKIDENRAPAPRLAATRDPLCNCFPHDVAWWRCQVSLAESERFQYTNYRKFLELSGGLRSVRAGAGRAISEPQILRRDLRELQGSVSAVIDALNADRDVPELIAVRDRCPSRVVLLKGPTRATATRAGPRLHRHCRSHAQGVAVLTP
jgi:hypothetical protein